MAEALGTNRVNRSLKKTKQKQNKTQSGASTRWEPRPLYTGESATGATSGKPHSDQRHTRQETSSSASFKKIATPIDQLGDISLCRLSNKFVRRFN